MRFDVYPCRLATSQMTYYKWSTIWESRAFDSTKLGRFVYEGKVHVVVPLRAWPCEYWLHNQDVVI